MKHHANGTDQQRTPGNGFQVTSALARRRAWGEALGSGTDA